MQHTHTHTNANSFAAAVGHAHLKSRSFLTASVVWALEVPPGPLPAGS